MTVPPTPTESSSLPSTAAFLLSSWWSRPVPEVVVRWHDLVSSASAVASAWGMDPDDLPKGSEEGSTLLVEEYERLFVGPGSVPCPPYESYWREDVSVDIRRTLMGPCVSDLQRLYSGLGIRLQTIPEMPDHIAVELEALGIALASPGAVRVARSLTGDHLGAWTGRFCRAVRKEAVRDHYRMLALVTREWLDQLQGGLDARPA